MGVRGPAVFCGMSRRAARKPSTSRRPEPYRVRISDPGEIAAGLPQLLGFRPVESVVVISLRGPSGRRVGLTVRADIPPAEHAGALARALTRSIRTDNPHAVLVAVVSEAPDEPEFGGPELPHRPLVQELTTALTDAGLPVREALLVRDGRWWSFDCSRTCCAPASGTPLPTAVTELAAASVAAGVVVAESREELESRIAPPGGLAWAAMDAAVLRVRAEEDVRAPACSAAELDDQAWAAVLAAVSRCAGGGPTALTDDEVARVLCALARTTVRDRALSLALGEEADAAEALWAYCTSRAPAPLDAAPATLLAVSAWLRGDGAMANVALERALGSLPGYRLAVLLHQALSRCVPPEELRAVLRDGAADGAADDAAWLRS
jgi:hypothetical protein